MQNYSYEIPAEELTRNAFQVAKQVQEIVLAEKIKPEDVLVIMGETHCELAECFWQTGFTQANHKIHGKINFFDEQPRQDRLYAQYQRLDGNLYKTASQYGDEEFAAMMPVSYVLNHRLAYHRTDLVIGDKDEKIAQSLPLSCLRNYKDIPYFHQLFSAYPHLFSAKGLNFDSVEGMLQRNVGMMAHTSKKIRNNPYFSLSRNGADHVVSEVALAPSLTELFLQTGKHIVTVDLTLNSSFRAKEDIKKIAEHRLQMFNSLPNDVRSNYLCHFDLALEEIEVSHKDRNPVQEKWRKIEAIQL